MIFLLALLFSATAQAREPIKVAILDSGLDLKDQRFQDVLCNEGHYDATGYGIADAEGHGTHIAGIIKEYAKDSAYCLIIVKYYDPRLVTNTSRMMAYGKGLAYISKIKPDVVNISGGGNSFWEDEHSIISWADYTIFAAVGNDDANLDKHCNYYPACYRQWESIPYLHAVASYCDNKKSSFSNYGTIVTDKECGAGVKSTLPNNKMGYMGGTSQATAIATGKYVYMLTH